MAVENQSQINPQQQKRGRAILLLLLIFFLVPSVVVMLMIKYDWKPTGNSHGELIQPPAMVTAPAQDNSFWMDKWHVVYIDEECAVGCLEKLKALRNLHVSMYKNMLRIKLVLLTKSTDIATIQNQYPGVIVLNESVENLDNVLNAFALESSTPLGAGNLYLVDPLGFIVMRFAPEIPMKKVRQDLVKLLKFAWAG